jgi:hypothetical protein
MSTKETYRQLCEQHPDIPLFMQAWWLDATHLPWDVILFEHKNHIAGFYVYSYTKKWGKTLIVQPQLTQYAGPFLFYPESLKQEQRYSFQNKAYNYFIEQLEKRGFDFLEQNFHHSQTYHQPFYWQGFKQSTRYTYVLDNTDTETVWQGLSSDKKKKYLRSEQSDLRLSLSLSHVDFYHLYKQCLSHKGQHIYYTFKTFEKLYLAAKDHQCGQILAIYDKQNQLHAALWIVWDNNAAYNMIIPIVEAHKSSGASTRLIFEAMRLLQGKTKQFDFEGSMIHGVALHNQSFGATHVPFFHIQKSHSKLLSLWRSIKK